MLGFLSVLAICATIVVIVVLEFVKGLPPLKQKPREPDLPEYERYLRKPLPALTDWEREGMRNMTDDEFRSYELQHLLGMRNALDRDK